MSNQKNIDGELQTGGSSLFTIASEADSHCKKFKCSQHTYKIRFNNIEKSFGDAQNEIQRLFTQLHDKFLNMMGPKDYIRIVFFHNDFDRPVGYPFMIKNQLETTDLQSTFDNVTQSYKQVQINEENTLTASIIIAKMPNGSGGTKTKIQSNYKNQQAFFDDSKHTIIVQNTALQWHYNVIKSIKRFFRKTYFCHQCKLAYSNIGDHLCKSSCTYCKRGKYIYILYRIEFFFLTNIFSN